MVTLAVNGQKLIVPPDVQPSTRLIEVLRSSTRFRGPKLACGEGGCGACAVLCERFDPVTGAVSRYTLNSCLATIGSLDGCAITTSEGVGNAKEGFHPIQDALAKNFASQCGYCTPGFTVALAAAAAAASSEAGGGACAAPCHNGDGSGGGVDRPSAVNLALGLDGNLCRCTGWRPIIDTCRDVADMEDLCSSSGCSSRGCSSTASACKAAQGGCRTTGEGSTCSNSSNSSSSSGTACKSLVQLPPFPAWLKEHVTARHSQQQQQQQQQPWQCAPGSNSGLYQQQQHQQQAAVGPTAVSGGGQSWLSPTSLQQLAAMLGRYGKGGAQLVAGNTGSGVYKELWPHDTRVIISPHSVAEMTAISYQAHGVILGGAVTIQQLLRVLRAPAASAGAAGAAASAGGGSSSSSGAPSSTAKAWGVMADHVERIAGVHVRSAATLGGHFGLCAIRPLPTDLGLLLAAAGTQLQVMTVHTYHDSSNSSSSSNSSTPQHWQQQQQGKGPEGGGGGLQWMSVEAFLEASAVGCAAAAAPTSCTPTAADAGAAAAAQASSVDMQLLTAEAIEGAIMLPPQATPPAPSQATTTSNTSGSSDNGGAGAAAAAAVVRVVTAVWLPYADDTTERFYSMKLSWRHVNAHAFVNMALWMRFDDSTTNNNNNRGSSSSSSRPDGSNVAAAATADGDDGDGDDGEDARLLLAAQSDPVFAGSTVSSVRLFVGCPPPAEPAPARADDGGGTTPAAAASSSSSSSSSVVVDEEAWRVLRASHVEAALTGSAVTVEVIIAALRHLEAQLLQQVDLQPHSFHSQALQGALFKALVPLLHTHSITVINNNSSNSTSGSSSSNSSGVCAAPAPAADKLLRLLRLPAAYDPRVLPSGRQVLPAPPGLQQHLLRQLEHKQQQQQQPQPEQQQQQQCAPGLLCRTTSGHHRLHAPSCHPHAGRSSGSACLTGTTAAVDTSTRHANDSTSSTTTTTTTPAAAAASAVSSGGGVVCQPEAQGAAGPLPLHLPVEKDAVRLQASGEAEYTADVAARLGGHTLYLAGVRSSRALAALVGVDASVALGLPGVVACLTASDVPGSNTVFGAPLLADGKVEYVGQLIALIAATSQTAADRAARRVAVTYQDLPGGDSPIITLDDAIAAGAFYSGDSAVFKAEAVKQPQPLEEQQEQQQQTSGAVTAHSAPACHRHTLQDTQSLITSDRTSSSSSSSSVAALIAAAPLRLSGQYDLPAQQHVYMETQTAVAEPAEDGAVRVWSATQSLDAVQLAVAEVLGVAFNQVSVLTRRLGGGFGGKASRSMPVAAAAALAATLLQRPVCYSLNRNEDFAVNAGRCAGRLEYSAGFKPDGKIVAIQAEVIFRAGAYLDLASNDGAALLAASDSAYDLSGLSVEVKFARCNLPPHTIMRGPGYLQGCMVMEQILEHVAAALGKDSAEVKAANFLPEVTAAAAAGLPSSPGSSINSDSGCSTHDLTYSSSDSSSSADLCDDGARAPSSPGSAATSAQDDCLQQPQANGACTVAEGSNSRSVSSAPQSAAAAAASGAVVSTALGRLIAAESYTLPRLWRELLQSSKHAERLEAVRRHNTQHAWSKRGLVVTPVRFDCAPAAVSASLSVYADGSVLVNHGGVEMGQGLSTKVKQAAVAALSELLPEGQRPLPLSLVRLSPSSSCINPNAGQTWSSTGSEGNCQAVMQAAAKVVDRLRPSLKVGKDALSTWQATVGAQFSDVGFAPSAVMLSAYGFFDGTLQQATSSSSNDNKDSTVSEGSRQAVKYSAFGAAVTEVELDLLTGDRRVLATDIAYDCGYSLNPRIDLGQVEGAFVMGLGAMLCEEVVVDPSSGRLLTDSTWTYKIPTPDLIPQQFTVSFLSDAPNPAGIAGSKASGEPALMTATSALLALQQAAAAAAAEVESLTAACGGNRHGRGGWKVLAAPATPQRVKSVIGTFSIADALQAALG